MGSSGNEHPAPKRKQHLFPKENYDSGCYSVTVCSLNVSWPNLAALPTTAPLKPMEAVGHAEPSTSLRHMAASEFTTSPPPKAKEWTCCVQTDKDFHHPFFMQAPNAYHARHLPCKRFCRGLCNNGFRLSEPYVLRRSCSVFQSQC